LKTHAASGNLNRSGNTFQSVLFPAFWMTRSARTLRVPWDLVIHCWSRWVMQVMHSVLLLNLKPIETRK